MFLMLWKLMLTGYARNRRLRDARMLFDSMPEKDVVSWNAMLSGYVRSGHVDEARDVFDRMPHKNSISWNGLLAAYVRSGRLEEARRLFESKSDWELISCNCLMGGGDQILFSEDGWAEDGIPLKDQFPERQKLMISGWKILIWLSQKFCSICRAGSN